LFASIGNSIVLSLLFSILSSDIITAHSILSSDSLLRILFLALTHYYAYVIYRGSPIILLFSQLGVGTSHLYIRATISLELGLKPNLVFNPRLVASPVSLLRVLPLSRFKAPFEALPSSLHNSTLGCSHTSLQTLIGCQPLRRYKETPVFAYKSCQLLLHARRTLRPLDLNTS